MQVSKEMGVKMEDKNNMSKLRQTAAGGGKLLSLIALAIILLGFAVPVYATDGNDSDNDSDNDNDNHVEITVSDTTQFERQGQLFKATANVTVKTVKPYGFNLTLQASNSDLANTSNPTTKIASTPATTPMALNSDQWGYSLNSKATTFSRVPNLTQPAAVLADVTKAKPAGCQNVKQCTKHVTYAANVDTRLLTPGEYSTEVVYTATAKPKPAFTDWEQRTAKVNPSEVCRSGDNNSSCLVDLDKNMIPVKYTGTTTNAQWTSISNPEDEDTKGNWYDYGKKQWANAVTVKKEALAKYQGQDKVVDQADILGFWVYIPRYTYEVMRRDGTDKPVKEQNFDIKFENTKTPKKRPLACKTGNGKDYRTECNVSRELPLMGGEVSTWTTHPAFSFGKKELNGFWFAKFETTGTNKQPTILPNEVHIDGYFPNTQHIGGFYALAKTIGTDDPNNVGGDTSNINALKNNHHLIKFSSRMVNNNDWGAAAYLSASKYGAGYENVHGNGYWGIAGTYERGVTGCGPYSRDSEDNYGLGRYGYSYTTARQDHPNIVGGKIGVQGACDSSNSDRSYNGSLGQLASTTNNLTGIYDMAGGAVEYVAAGYSINPDESGGAPSERTDYFGNKARYPYVNTYNFDNVQFCTFGACGGQALYLRNISFVNGTRMWFMRGGYPADSKDIINIFTSYSYDGFGQYENREGNTAFRVTLGDFRQN